MTRLVRAVNWNRLDDPFDLDVWNRLTANFWLPEKIAVSNDIPSWRSLTDEERTVTKRVFTGLTLLDTIQAVVGATSLIPDAITPHEAEVYTNIAFMESVHSKSYSTIFSTLCSTQEIDEAYKWSDNNVQLQKKAEIVLNHYDGTNPLKRKAASTLLESFLFYSGFYWPFYLASRNKLPNSADIVRLIVRDEAVHGAYIGYKFQKGYDKLSANGKQDLQEFVIELLLTLYNNEIVYTQNMYDSVGRTEDVKKFLKYNANKALMNLGFDPIYNKEETAVDPAIMSSLSLGGENHDFFSGSGSTYTQIKSEQLSEDDWAW